MIYRRKYGVVGVKPPIESSFNFGHPLARGCHIYSPINGGIAKQLINYAKANRQPTYVNAVSTEAVFGGTGQSRGFGVSTSDTGEAEYFNYGSATDLLCPNGITVAVVTGWKGDHFTVLRLATKATGSTDATDSEWRLGNFEESNWGWWVKTGAGWQGVPSLKDNGLHLMVGTYDGVTLRIYQDGVEQNTSVVSSAIVTGSGDITLMGYQFSGNTNWNSGWNDNLIHFFALWDRALSVNEIQWLWQEPYDLLITPKRIRQSDLGGGSVTISVSDTLSLLESIVILGLDPFLQADLTDALSLSDSLSAIISTPEEFSDALSLSDAIIIDKPVSYDVSDTLALSDAVVLDFTIRVLIADLLQLSDHVQTGLDQKLELLIQDSLVLIDNPLTAAAWQANLSDALSLSDAIVVLRELAFSDSLSLSDAATTLLESIFTDVQRMASDEIQLFDSIQLSATVEGYLFGDSLPLGDSVGVVFNSNPTDYLRRYLNDVTR